MKIEIKSILGSLKISYTETQLRAYKLNISNQINDLINDNIEVIQYFIKHNIYGEVAGKIEYNNKIIILTKENIIQEVDKFIVYLQRDLNNSLFEKSNNYEIKSIDKKFIDGYSCKSFDDLLKYVFSFPDWNYKIITTKGISFDYVEAITNKIEHITYFNKNTIITLNNLSTADIMKIISYHITQLQNDVRNTSGGNSSETNETRKTVVSKGNLKRVKLPNIDTKPKKRNKINLL